MPVLLHIGFCKTGSTSIQHYLRDHESLLAEHGIRFPRGWLRLNNHFELPLTLMRLDRMSVARQRGDEWRDASWRRQVLTQIIADLERHPDELTVISAEALSLFRYDDEFTAVREIVGDAKIVAVVRSQEHFLASLSAHYCKPDPYGMPGLNRDDPDAYNYLEPDSWRADYSTLLSAWGRHFTNLSIISYDNATACDGSIVPEFLSVLGIPPQADATNYWLNARTDPIVRVEGNRLTNGHLFGD